MTSSIKYKEINNWIREGMATILWADAWANHVEHSWNNIKNQPLTNIKTRCYNLSGKEITQVMPEIPKIANQLSYRLANKYKYVNNKSIVDLFVLAMKAQYPEIQSFSYEDIFEDHVDDGVMPVMFGECLTFMSLGHGVSWFDDYENFPLNIPSIDNYDLQDWAVDNCEKCNEN